MEREYLLRVEGASLTYPGGRRALENASMSIDAGELVALVGPNGGGKTSLLRLIGGLAPGFYDVVASGNFFLKGIPLKPGDPALRENASFLQPDPQLQVVGLTPFHEALLAPIIKGLERQEALKLAHWALELVELNGMKHEPTSYLSTGLLQRAGLAGLLTSQSRLLLLDEPTSHLDPEFRKRVPSLLKKLSSSQGIGIVVAGQDPLLARHADRVYCVDRKVWECSSGWEEWLARNTVNSEQLEASRSFRLRADSTAPASKSQRVISIKGAELTYPGGKTVLQDIELEARVGELVALVGPNGGGKTSLLRLIGGLLKPSKGTVKVELKPAYLPSEPSLIFSRGTLKEELGDAKSPLELPELIKDTPITWLSRGQLQLAALSLILAKAPSTLLLLDEPTFALDPGWSMLVRELLKKLAETGYTVVVATHDEELARIADRVYMVRGGRVWEA